MCGCDTCQIKFPSRWSPCFHLIWGGARDENRFALVKEAEVPGYVVVNSCVDSKLNQSLIEKFPAQILAVCATCVLRQNNRSKAIKSRVKQLVAPETSVSYGVQFYYYVTSSGGIEYTWKSNGNEIIFIPPVDLTQHRKLAPSESVRWIVGSIHQISIHFTTNILLMFLLLLPSYNLYTHNPISITRISSSRNK